MKDTNPTQEIFISGQSGYFIITMNLLYVELLKVIISRGSQNNTY